MLTYSKTFDELPPPDAVIEDSNACTAKYTISCGDNVLFSARLPLRQAVQAKLDFECNACLIESIAKQYPKVRFTNKPMFKIPEKYMPVYLTGERCALPVNLSTYHPALLEHFDSNVIKWILNVDKHSDVDLFDSDVRFNCLLSVIKVVSKGVSNLLIVNRSKLNIWALTDGKPADIDTPEFSVAMTKLLMLDGLV